MRVRFSAEAEAAITSLLNLHETHGYGFRMRRSYGEYYAGRPPLMLFRLFAYLRECLPAKATHNLPSLFRQAGRAPAPGMRQRTPWAYMLREFGAAGQIGDKKRSALSKAAKVYSRTFVNMRFDLVPDSNKADFVDSVRDSYFQAFQEPHGVLKVMAIREGPLSELRELIAAVPAAKCEYELIRSYSPESDLMELYIPALRLTRGERVLADVGGMKNIGETLGEIDEERFVHAIRATGIAVEELLVDIYETYTHEKAPAVPLGELLTNLSTRVNQIALVNSKRSIRIIRASRSESGVL